MSFPATNWSIVVRAKGLSDEANSARNALCETYYYPVYTFFRRSRFDQDTAFDHTNSFFAEFLQGDRVRKGLLAKADPSRGIAFRAYLIVSLKQYLSELHRASSTQKRGGHTYTTSLDAMSVEQRYKSEPCYLDNPEQQLSLSWALSVVEQALARTKKAFGDSRFEALKPYLAGTDPAPRYHDSAKELGMTVDALKQTVSRLRKLHRRSLRQIVADTVSHPDDIEDEWNELFDLLRIHFTNAR